MKQIILSQKIRSWKNAVNLCVFLILFSAAPVFAQSFTVTGTVSDSNGELLPGASVMIKGTFIGTITNANGQYTLNQVTAESVLQISFIGYVSQEIIVGDQRTINVTMNEDASTIEEVVVVGYGIQKKSVVTAAISSVKAADIEKITPARVENVLRGQVSGVSITQNSGAPNSDVSIRVRGVGTTGDNNPLYIVDGMVVGGGISNINPADIASIEILKDAASAAVTLVKSGSHAIIIRRMTSYAKFRSLSGSISSIFAISIVWADISSLLFIHIPAGANFDHMDALVFILTFCGDEHRSILSDPQPQSTV